MSWALVCMCARTARHWASSISHWLSGFIDSINPVIRQPWPPPPKTFWIRNSLQDGDYKHCALKELPNHIFEVWPSLKSCQPYNISILDWWLLVEHLLQSWFNGKTWTVEAWHPAHSSTHSSGPLTWLTPTLSSYRLRLESGLVCLSSREKFNIIFNYWQFGWEWMVNKYNWNQYVKW
jgi:hypothetical protein